MKKKLIFVTIILIIYALLIALSRITYQISPLSCTQCGRCSMVCPTQAVYSDSLTYEIRINQSSCTGCGTCVAECRWNAIYQNDGRSFIMGTITDSTNGMPIINADVAADTVHAITNWSGNYGLSLYPGTYDLTFQADNFITQYINDLVVGADTLIHINSIMIPITSDTNDAISISNAGLSVYPNPSQGVLVFQLQKRYSASLQISIYNIKGQKVFAGTSAGKENAIHWNGRVNSGSKAPSGLYYVRIADGKRTYVRKFAIVKSYS